MGARGRRDRGGGAAAAAAAAAAAVAGCWRGKSFNHNPSERGLRNVNGPAASLEMLSGVFDVGNLLSGDGWIEQWSREGNVKERKGEESRANIESSQVPVYKRRASQVLGNFLFGVDAALCPGLPFKSEEGFHNPFSR